MLSRASAYGKREAGSDMSSPKVVGGGMYEMHKYECIRIDYTVLIGRFSSV